MEASINPVGYVVNLYTIDQPDTPTEQLAGAYDTFDEANQEALKIARDRFDPLFELNDGSTVQFGFYDHYEESILVEPTFA